MRRAGRGRRAIALRSLLWALALLVPGLARAVEPVRVVVAVLPFEVHSEKPLDYLESSLAELLSTRLEASGQVDVVEAVTVRETLVAWPGERSEDALRRLARELRADWIVVGSLTELAGQYSLDVRVTPVESRVTTSTLAYSANGDDELLDRVNELARRILGIVGGSVGAATVARVEVLGAPDEDAVRAVLTTEAGAPYAEAEARADLARIEALPGIAGARLETDPAPGGVVVTYHVIGAARLLDVPLAAGDDGVLRVTGLEVRGNRRIEAAAILARVTHKVGEPFSVPRLAADVRSVYALGFFSDVSVFEESDAEGIRLTFEVAENPVVRQVTLSGNENVDSEKITNILTLTTGSTLDYPLLFENRQRIEGLYRAEGYYTAKVRSQVETLTGDAVGVNFEVDEGEKLKLRRIEFEGNDRKTDDELADGLKTKTWRWYSFLTSWLDKTGTYSEPVFLQDLETVSNRYLDDGYVRADVGSPEVVVEEDGLVVKVSVAEGDQYHLGSAQLSGDESADWGALQEDLALAKGDVFSRSKLNTDLQTLESHYTDRGFFMAQVRPLTRVDEDKKEVDVDYSVEKGSLYFLREIDVTGNQTTVDPVVRREVRLVEGQLYSARALDLSKRRIQGLGYFEEVNFEPRQTDFGNQLDLDVKVVEKPTGSLSFGAGVSSRDGFVISGAVSDSNLFGRGLAGSLGADIGGESERFFLNFAVPYVMGTTWGLSTQLSIWSLEFDDFEMEQTGAEFALSHPLDETGRTRGFVRYGYSDRNLVDDLILSGEVPAEVGDPDGEQGANATSAAMIFRDIYHGSQVTSLVGLGFRRDTRNDRVAATEGHVMESSIDFAGIGGFSNFVRWEGRAGFFFSYPDWFPDWVPFKDNSAWLLGLRGGWTLPMNSIGDWDLPGYEGDLDAVNIGQDEFGVQMLPLTLIDEDLELPLSERYFMGGLGSFQLRGFKARSVGPRRAVLQPPIAFEGLPSDPDDPDDPGIEGSGTLFTPVGRAWFTGACMDFIGPIDPDDPDSAIFDGSGFEGNLNGKCNSINDKDIDDFEDLDETDVIGGNKFASVTVEYRFPIAESVGLMGILFFDTGNAFDETQSVLDFSEWRQGAGGGLLWFSPFGPLQVFLGVPLDKLEVEDSTAFEFSVGGQGF